MQNSAQILILARGGSKRIPRKVLQKLGETTLLQNTIGIGKSTGMDVFVSSEDHEILDLAKKDGAKTILRPLNLASDTAKSADAAVHAIEFMACDTVILMQATSPFATCEEVLAALNRHRKTGKAIFSSVSSPSLLWSWNRSQPIFPCFQEVRSQDLTPVFVPCGAFFITSKANLLAHRSFFKPEAEPFEIPKIHGLDIDTQTDLDYARFLWHQQQ